VSVNLAVIRGRCSSPADVRILPSGQAVATLQVTTRPDPEGPARSVPVAVWDPPAWVEALDEGAEVVVVGEVRRRFWRAGAGAASRVEVSALQIARGSDKRRVAKLCRAAGEALELLSAPQPPS
jgi:single-strand DNA-binding protein